MWCRLEILATKEAPSGCIVYMPELGGTSTLNELYEGFFGFGAENADAIKAR